MIQIIITVCRLAEPQVCEEQRLPLVWHGSAHQCTQAAQPYIARWIGDHPEWRVKNFYCGYPGREDHASAVPSR